ncbi:divalent cation tolerance protein [Rubritalea squalenifaciens DSM 18772]|uniref:Divalent cation tolerance protein n=2 Tax=Rubritalea TaxID=361050 RepID=A0A1M6HYT1_9BACT|nr:divalent-cation tolerance protein CutA [Rubritalea squalenifaciens]SHJ27311.1 divalent cation tolerance protein [Rubritalea squalenifaciens DSM 18772]
MNVLVVLVTFPEEKCARQIGTVLIEKQLAACVNIIPGAESIYRWEGKVCCEKEVIGIIKTTEDAYQALEHALVDLHPYDVPELIALRPETGSRDYLSWVRGEVLS